MKKDVTKSLLTAQKQINISLKKLERDDSWINIHNNMELAINLLKRATFRLIIYAVIKKKIKNTDDMLRLHRYVN